jgi:deoxycytidylate deaminase
MYDIYVIIFKRKRFDMRKKDYRFFNSARKEAQLSHSLHSEINAIKSIPITLYDSIDWKKVDLYVFRISPGKDLGQGLARPCSACMKAIRDLGIQNIYYTTDDGYCYERIF